MTIFLKDIEQERMKTPSSIIQESPTIGHKLKEDFLLNDSTWNLSNKKNNTSLTHKDEYYNLLRKSKTEKKQKSSSLFDEKKNLFKENTQENSKEKTHLLQFQEYYGIGNKDTNNKEQINDENYFNKSCKVSFSDTLSSKISQEWKSIPLSQNKSQNLFFRNSFQNNIFSQNLNNKERKNTWDYSPNEKGSQVGENIQSFSPLNSTQTSEIQKNGNVSDYSCFCSFGTCCNMCYHHHLSSANKNKIIRNLFNNNQQVNSQRRNTYPLINPSFNYCNLNNDSQNNIQNNIKNNINNEYNHNFNNYNFNFPHQYQHQDGQQKQSSSTSTLQMNFRSSLTHNKTSIKPLTPPLNPQHILNTKNEQKNKTKAKKETNDDPNNKIHPEQIVKGKEKRTTVMIRHIPNKYILKTLKEDIDVCFEGKYDVFYLPVDYKNKCNLGYAFINFVDSFHIVSFFDYFRGKKWPRFNSDKICELAYAKFQGKNELISHYEKGSVMGFENEELKPLIIPTPNVLPDIEIPIKYYKTFFELYKYSDCIQLQDKFIVKKFFRF